MEKETTSLSQVQSHTEPKTSKTNILAFAVFLVVAVAGGVLYVLHDGSSAKVVVSSSPSTGSTTTTTTTNTAQNTGTVASAPLQGQAAPDFTLVDTAGNTVSLADYKGGPTLIVFEATWCTFCKRENADLEKFVKEYEGKVDVLTVDLREDAKTVADTWKVRENKRKVVLDLDGAVAMKYGASGTPTHVFIKPDQTVALYKPGLMSYQELVAGAEEII